MAFRSEDFVILEFAFASLVRVPLDSSFFAPLRAREDSYGSVISFPYLMIKNNGTFTKLRMLPELYSPQKV